MTPSVQSISLVNLSLAFIPVVVALFILIKWSLDSKRAVHAIARMLIQLLLIGYLLTFIFQSDSAWVVLLVLTIMIICSSWIALSNMSEHRVALFKYAVMAIVAGGGLTLFVMSQGVLALNPWYWPQYMIPLAGMIFANAMNSVSLAGDRILAELKRGVSYTQARNTAMQTSLIPVTNSLFAVGLVSLPGMMTGQILSGVSPMIAVRYQIMVMCMIFASSVICAALFMVFAKPVLDVHSTPKKPDQS
jgi:putative ABC transport system permease protein